MPSVADRLRQAREQRGYKSAAEAARYHNWRQSTYRAHENGQRGVPREWLPVYARAYGVTLSWLIRGQEEALTNDGTIHLVPILEWSSIPKGAPVQLSDLSKVSPAQNIATSSKLGETVGGLEVRDDSMTSPQSNPLSLFKGDHVVVTFNVRVPPGKLGLIYDDDDQRPVFRKAEYIDRDTIRFVALNPAYPSITLKASSRKILGTVVHISRNLT